MSKITRSYSLDPPVAEWLDRQPDGRGGKATKMYRHSIRKSRSALVSEAVYYYWMNETELMSRIKRLMKINEIYLEELRELRSRRGLWYRLKRLLKIHKEEQ